MDNVTIITNNVPRDCIDAMDLTDEERAEFNYVDWNAIDRGDEVRDFVRYKGRLIDLNDTEGRPQAAALKGWDAFISDSFFSGILIRYVLDDFGYTEDAVVMGRYYC